MLTEYDKLTIGDVITIDIKALSKDTRFKEKEETALFLNKFKLNDLKFEYEIGEVTESDATRPFIAVYLFGLIDGYQKLDYLNECDDLNSKHPVRYYHHNVVSKYVERGLEDFLEIISEMEEQFRSSRKSSREVVEDEE